MCPRGCIFVEVHLQCGGPHGVPLAWLVRCRVEVEVLLCGPAVVGQEGVHDGRVVAVVKGVLWRLVLNNLGQHADVPRRAPGCPTLWGVVVAGGPVCPSSTPVSYFGQSCNIRSTYVTSVCGWMLCSARVRAWAKSLYSVPCGDVSLEDWVSVCSGSSASVGTFPWRTVCATVYSSSPPPGVQSK